MKVESRVLAVVLLFLPLTGTAIDVHGVGQVQFSTTIGEGRDCSRLPCDYDVFNDSFNSQTGSASGAANSALGASDASSNGVIGVQVATGSIRLGHAWNGSIRAGNEGGVRSQFYAQASGDIFYDHEITPSIFSATFVYDILDGPVYGGRGILNEITAEVRADSSYPLSFTTGAIGTFYDGGAVTASGTVSGHISARITSSVAIQLNASGTDTGGFRSALNIVVGLGATQANPVLPASLPPAGTAGSFLFESAQSGAWFDPTPTETFDFEMQDGSLFTHIISLPEGFDDPFTVSVGDQVLGEYGHGEVVSFLGLLGEGVSSFSVSGINPFVDGDDPMAFPIQLAFDNPTATFTMKAAPVPLPAPFLLLGSALAALGLCKRPRAVCS